MNSILFRTVGRPILTIQSKEATFTGGPSFRSNGSNYIPHSSPVKYVGPPSDEIVDNWGRLTWGRYILITAKAAHAAWGPDIDEFWDSDHGGYIAGLDMFHTPHCLGSLRKALHPEYYGAMQADANHMLHHDPCIEQLRQYIMCSGDMAPVPTRYYEASGRNYVNSDMVHTCRDLKSLQRWIVDRYEGPGAIKPVL